MNPWDEDPSTPYETVVFRGLRAASSSHLLAVLASENAEHATELFEAAKKFVSARSALQFGELSPADLQDLCPDLPEYMGARLLCAIELGRRSMLSARGEVKTVSCANDAYRLFKYLESETQEHVCALFLNAKNYVLARRTVHIGTLDSSPVGMREILREAVRANAAKFILVHNHPSGDPQPSAEDVAVTSRLASAAELLDIELADHLVIGYQDFRSLKQMRLF